jgi:hypothetical protein
VYLHHVFDLWIEVWREKVAKGKVMAIRYADDLVVGFERRDEACAIRSRFAVDQERLWCLAHDIDPVMLIKPMVFSGEHRVDKRRRNLGDRHDTPLLPIALKDRPEHLGFEFDRVRRLMGRHFFKRNHRSDRRYPHRDQLAGKLRVGVAEAMQKKLEAAAFPFIKAVLAAGFAEIMARVKQLNAKRLSSQPLKEKSAGCIFKNPPGQSTGKMIDVLGMKGMRVGGAVVSERHANFFVNRFGATSDDFFRLMDIVRERIHAAHGIELEAEVIVWKN